MRDQWSSRLSEYLDGELPAKQRQALESHLGACESCRASLDALRRVVERLDAAPDREPSADLWPGLKRKIEGEGSGSPAPGPDRRIRRAGRGPWAGWRILIPAVAAALLLAALWSWRGGGVGLGPGSGEGELPAPAPDGVTPAPVAGRYVQAAAAWDELLARRDLPPEVAAVLKAEMTVFDRAIAETRRALAEAPEDPDLRAHLAATLRAKVRYLARIGELTGESS